MILMKAHCHILLVLALPLLLSGCKKKEAQTDEAAMPVDVAQVYEDSVMIRNTFPGILEARSKVDVVARVNGTIRSQNFQAGDYVRAGQVLFTIEPTVYNNAVQEAGSSLENARSAYAYASRQYEALKKALAADAVAEMEVIRAKSAMEEAKAQIQSAQAALSDARTNLGYCTVRAPISGYISDSSLKPGAYVGGAASPTPLATIYDNSTLLITFSIPDASYIEMFTPGQGRPPRMDFSSMPITFSDSLVHDYKASVTYLSPSIDPSTGTLEIKALVRNPYNELKNGMYARIGMPFRSEPHAMIVRDAAISTDQHGAYLYLVNDSDKVVYTPVKTGELYQDTLRVIESGIKPGDRYVTRALLKMRPGMKVKPVLRR